MKTLKELSIFFVCTLTYWGGILIVFKVVMDMLSMEFIKNNEFNTIVIAIALLVPMLYWSTKFKLWYLNKYITKKVKDVRV